MPKLSKLAREMRALAQRARDASRILATASTAQKNRALVAAAAAIGTHSRTILEANHRDLVAARRTHLSPAMLDRLALNPDRLKGMVRSLREIAALPDPVGEVTEKWKRPNGLVVKKVRIPLGVVLMIYEARPNVTVDAAALCVKSGNAAILRAGSEAFESSRALGAAFAEGLSAAGLPRASAQVVPTTDRAATSELLKLDDLVDLCIPRGGYGLIRAVAEQSRIPVVKHFEGVCHLFLDSDAREKDAVAIAVNAKAQRVSVCNAMETLLVDAAVAERFLPKMAARLREAGVEMRGDDRTRSLVPDARPATVADWDTEYLDYIVAIRVVDGLDAAIEHIRRHGSGVAEAIVTSDLRNSRRFTREVDAAAVLVNASTRLVDGSQFGMGAEMGISTSRLHARGPVGVRELTTTKFVLMGDGQVRE